RSASSGQNSWAPPPSILARHNTRFGAVPGRFSNIGYAFPPSPAAQSPEFDSPSTNGDWRQAGSGSKRRRMRLAFLIGLGVAACTAFAGSARGQGALDSARSPIVVELFTSQGCNTCPPADAFLAELAARPDLLALSFHVDYWDYIGWKDPFAQR